MPRRVCLSIVAVIGLVAGLAAAPGCAGQGGGLHVVKSWPAGTDGWDYVTVDPQARRVYVARSNRIAVFDADKGTLIGEVNDIAGGHGVALAPQPSGAMIGFATCGKDGTVAEFDTNTLKVVRKIPAGKRPDAILYDPASKKVFAFNHAGGDVTIIDPVAAADAKPATLPIGGTLEFGVADGAGKVYVNVEDKGEVVAIDSKQQKIIGRWPVAPGAEPTGLAIDVANRRLFVGCGNRTMVILDADSGKVLGSVPVGAGVDGVAFLEGVESKPGVKSNRPGLAVTANGKDGTMTVVQEGPRGQFTVIQTLNTARGARTVAADPKTRQFYLPCTVPGRNNVPTFGLLVVGAE